MDKIVDILFLAFPGLMQAVENYCQTMYIGLAEAFGRLAHLVERLIDVQ